MAVVPRATPSSTRIISTVQLVVPLIFALLTRINVSDASSGGGGGGGCVEQLRHDGCVPALGTHQCADCAENHKGDLEKASCSEPFVLAWCEGQVGDCGATLIRQESVHVNCTRGLTYGCTDSSGAMWTAKGCRGVFACGGATAVECDSGRGDNKTCECKLGPAPPPPQPPINASTVTVLVFGDSWGSLGPGWHELQDMFDRHNVSAVVRSAARGGTQACQWAAQPTSMVEATKKLFPERNLRGPDFVWYTLGGNDFANKNYQNCSHSAKTLADELLCIDKLFTLVSGCTRTLLEHYWKVYPHSKVMQCGYDIPCEKGGCIHTDDSRVPFCQSNVTCMDETTLHWQKIYVDALDTHYNQPGGAPGGGSYAGLNILGTVQAAGGVPGASVGHPVIGVGSPCDLETMCVHPTHGKAGATAVGEAFWDLYYSKHLLVR